MPDSMLLCPQSQSVCEVCEQSIPDGQEIVHPVEGDSYCARCCAALICVERDALREALERIVVCCDNGSRPDNKLTFIRRVARKALSDADRKSVV